MSEDNAKQPKERAGNSHDKFGRKYMRIVPIASDLLRYYAESLIAEYVDVDRLQPAPTHGISKKLKEVVTDISFLARLKDAAARAEVLFLLEHKSRPNRMVALQVGTQAFLTLYSEWTDAGYTDSQSFELPIPIMVVLYHGTEDWAEKEIQFQDLFQNIPPALQHLVPRFTVLVINLRRFQYGKLPGRPATQAFVESLMRATDGTFAANLESVLRHVRAADLDKAQTWDFVETITTYCSWAEELTEERFKQAVLTVFTGPEGIEMSETIPKGMLRDGYELGRTSMRIESKIEDVLAVLFARFKTIPKPIVDGVSGMTDIMALESILTVAATCDTLDEFAEALK